MLHSDITFGEEIIINIELWGFFHNFPFWSVLPTGIFLRTNLINLVFTYNVYFMLFTAFWRKKTNKIFLSFLHFHQNSFYNVIEATPKDLWSPVTWYLYCSVHVKTEKDSVGVEFKLLKIQLIICSVSGVWWLSLMCESKSKPQQSCRGFQNSNFYWGFSQEQRCVFPRREEEKCQFVSS